MSGASLERLEFTPPPRTFATSFSLLIPAGALLPMMVRGLQGGLDVRWAIAAILLSVLQTGAMWRSMRRPPHELLIDEEGIHHRTPGGARWWNRPILGSSDPSQWSLSWGEIESVEIAASEVDGKPCRILTLNAATKRMIVLESRIMSAIAEPERLLAHFRRRGYDV